MNNLNVRNYPVLKLRNCKLSLKYVENNEYKPKLKQILMFDHKMMLEYFVIVNWLLRIVYLAPE